MRRSSGTRAYIIIVCFNAVAMAAFGLDMHYLKTHRPAVPDPARGFVLREETRHPDGVFYESAHDRTIYWALAGLDIFVFAASSGISYLHARARQRQAIKV